MSLIHLVTEPIGKITQMSNVFFPFEITEIDLVPSNTAEHSQTILNHEKVMFKINFFTLPMLHRNMK